MLYHQDPDDSVSGSTMEQAVNEVAKGISRRGKIQLVLDPVLISTSGDSLASSEVCKAVVKQ